MSWIEKELKKRASVAATKSEPDAAPVSETDRMSALWGRFENANQALPGELRLQVNHPVPASGSATGPKFQVWISAPNGAALGFTGDAIRYVWPERSQRKSSNFWIRWNPDIGYCIHQRLGSSRLPPMTLEYRFDERRVDDMIRLLVVNRRVKTGSVRRKRLWLF